MVFLGFEFVGVLFCVIFAYFWFVFFFKQKTAYEVRISDWSSDVCSSDLSATSLRWHRSRQTSSELSGLLSLTRTISRPPGTCSRASASTRTGRLVAPL